MEGVQGCTRSAWGGWGWCKEMGRLYREARVQGGLEPGHSTRVHMEGFNFNSVSRKSKKESIFSPIRTEQGCIQK